MMPRDTSTPTQIASGDDRINVFREFINQIDLTTMPAKYISRVKLTYEDGKEEEMGFDCSAVTDPMAKLDNLVKERITGPIKHSRVVIDLMRLERDVTQKVNTLLGPLG